MKMSFLLMEKNEKEEFNYKLVNWELSRKDNLFERNNRPKVSRR